MDVAFLLNVIIRFGRMLAELTETEIDDSAVDGLASLRDSPAFMQWLESLWNAPQLPPGVMTQADIPADVAREFNIRGFDIAQVLPLIQWVITLLRATSRHANS